MLEMKNDGGGFHLQVWCMDRIILGVTQFNMWRILHKLLFLVERLVWAWICQRTALYTLCPDLQSWPSFDLRPRCQIRDDSSNTRVDHHSRRDTHKQNFRDIELRPAVWPAGFRGWGLSFPCGQSQHNSSKESKNHCGTFMASWSHGDCTLKRAKHTVFWYNVGTLWRSHITAVSALTCFDFQHAKHVFLILSQFRSVL